MTGKAMLAAALALSGLASGCTSATHSIRPEAITIGAGDAVAANTALQMVDPWPAGVNDTDIDAPADRSPYEPKRTEEAKGVTTSDISG